MGDTRTWWTWFYNELWWAPGTDWRWAQVYGVVTVGIVVAMLSFAPRSPDAAPPAVENLRILDGVVASVTHDEAKVEFALGEWKPLFRYSAKAGALDVVVRELRAGRIASVSVDRSSFDPKLSDVVTVYALALDGKQIRTLADVRTDWVDSNRVEPLLLFLLALGAVALFATAMYERVRQERGSGNR